MTVITKSAPAPVGLGGSQEAMIAELERLKAENAALKANKAKAGESFSMKISEKGGLSVYGLGRFPTTLYQEQWTKLLNHAEDIRAFMKANEKALTRTPEEIAAQKAATKVRTEAALAALPKK